MLMIPNVFTAGLGVSAGLLVAPLALVRLREQLDPQQLPGAQRFVHAGGYQLHYTDEGPPDGPVVVLCHGFASWAFTWRHQRRALAEAGYRVISIDQLGNGASARPLAPVYSTRDQCDLLLAALDALGVEQMHLVGHSFGGRLALQAAIAAPGRVRSLVAICPESFSTTRPPIAAIVSAPLFGFALAYYSLAPALVPLGLRSLSGSGAWVTEEVARGYASPLLVRGSVDAQVWQARSPKDGAQPVPHNLHAVSCPVLLLWGTGDTVFPPSDGERLAQALPEARLRLLDGAGHLPHEECAADVNQEILAFIQEHGSGG